ncbi:DNA repair protein RadC [Patescibacteria group bacterium]|nr:DNA repair protein RadC [Patescibacteria group bacterium]MBU4078426.1 DNA repair protein RadC [Patescibacteria group bacterium]MBU4161975.1 DNA repair protein RadC [Patescibacteria group bacterium]
MVSTDGSKYKSAGHRKRLRERFLQSGLNGFADYEVIELLLTLNTPRKDCKPMAKEAIKKFNGIVGVLDASIDELMQIDGIGPSNAIGVNLFQNILEIYAKEKINLKKELNTPQMLFEFLKEKIGKEKKEHFAILFFDTRNKLIVNNVSVGSLNASIVHPREVFNDAVLKNASYVVIAHNHPSGDPTPSEEDIFTTKRLVEAGRILGISVSDHMIVARNNYYSFAEKGNL